MTGQKRTKKPDPSCLDERLAMLGIPPYDMTPAVNLAVTALLEKLDDVSRELAHAKETAAELERMVDIDLVAPVPNRRAFMRRLEWAITMHARYGHPSAILYFDLNGFKQINDRYGHAAGDAAIRHAAQLIAGAMRESDFMGRIGGDEFAVIMYHAKEEAARRRGRRIVDALTRAPLLFGGRTITVSSACGCYALRPGDSPESALSAADMSMYMDKKRAQTA